MKINVSIQLQVGLLLYFVGVTEKNQSPAATRARRKTDLNMTIFDRHIVNN
jgi:hypothetical protein